MLFLAFVSEAHGSSHAEYRDCDSMMKAALKEFKFEFLGIKSLRMKGDIPFILLYVALERDYRQRAQQWNAHKRIMVA